MDYRIGVDAGYTSRADKLDTKREAYNSEGFIMPRPTAYLCRLSKRRIWVLPYVRGRLIFAEIAARTLHGRAFDTLLLDLPSFMNRTSWLDGPLMSFPLVSSLIVQDERDTCSLYPLVPTDAACATAWLARRRSLAFECVDPVMLLSSACGDIPAIDGLEDERLIMLNGLRSYFEKAWFQLECLWQSPQQGPIRNLIEYGEAVADRVSDRIYSNGEVLFVCEYRLWWAVRKALELEGGRRCGGARADKSPPERTGALVFEDPYLMWAAGLFDDFLTVNRRFHEGLESDSVADFEKYSILAGIIRKISSRSDLKRLEPDLSAGLVSLVESLKSRTIPEVVGTVSPRSCLEGMQSQLNAEAGNALPRLLLEYPLPTTADTARNPPEYFQIAEERIVPSDKWFTLPDVFHVRPYGELPRPRQADEPVLSEEKNSRIVSWLHQVHPVMTRQEIKSLGSSTGGSRWAVTSDYKEHMRACQVVREALGRAEMVDPEREKPGVFTPVTFIFCDCPDAPRRFTVVSDNNITRRQLDLQGNAFEAPAESPAPDSVYSLFATIQAEDSLLEEHIERESISSLTLLYSGAEMGLERYAAITSEPARFQCRLRPQEDPALSAFDHFDLGLAWAIRYARRIAIAVAYSGWEPSSAIRRFARRWRKQILTLPLDVLPADLAGRLSRLHFISTALKLHPDSERIVARFVR